jgi:uroporphyrinogen-III synthase
VRVWVTRDEPPDGPLSEALRAVGLDVIHAPVIKRTLTADPRHILADMQEGDWLVLTSPFAINAVPIDFVNRARLAVVGRASRKLAARLGLDVAFSPSVPSAAALFRELAAQATPDRPMRLWYPSSAAAAVPMLSDNVMCHAPVLYETTAIPYDSGLTAEADIIALASPTAVRAIDTINVQCASIGPTTTAALAERGITPIVTADHPTFRDLAAAIQALRDLRHERA